MSERDPLKLRWAARRRFVRQFGALGAAALFGRSFAGAPAEEDALVLLPFENGERELVRYPQKRPLIRLTTRPPQLETPFSVFRESMITPNDAFFVRYHLSGIPTRIDPASHRLRVGGLVATALDLSLEDLKGLGSPAEIIAVNQCSGNSRGFFKPRVNGGQMGHGAMGNARWTGIALKTVLEKAGVLPGAVQVTFDGLDRPPLPATPDFVKALPLDHALDGEVLIAWAMNGADLPLLNGYPLRLVVPGYYGTYWVKHLAEIRVVDRTFDGFYMRTAYRIPDNPCACVAPGATPDNTVPIGRFKVRSFITHPAEGAVVPAGVTIAVRGFAFGGGDGIREVGFSGDGGGSWHPVTLHGAAGRYAFQEWRSEFQPKRRGVHELQVRAIDGRGQQQPDRVLWNPAGYSYNAVETVRVQAL